MDASYEAGKASNSLGTILWSRATSPVTAALTPPPPANDAPIPAYFNARDQTLTTNPVHYPGLLTFTSTARNSVRPIVSPCPHAMHRAALPTYSPLVGSSMLGMGMLRLAR